MEAELHIGLPSDISAAAAITYEFPKNRRYLIQNTPLETTKWPGSSMARQSLKGDNFVAELHIMDANKPFTADLRIKKRNLIFFFTLKGYFSYKSNGHTFQILQDESAIFQVLPGRFQIRILSGHHVYFFFYLKSGMLKKLARDYDGLKPLLEVAPQQQLIHLSDSTAQAVTQALFKLRRVRKEGRITELDTERILLELAYSTKRGSKSIEKEKQKTTRDVVLGIREYIGTEISRGSFPTIKEIAEVVSLTPRRLGEVFHDLFGLSLRSYINARRMEEARRLLNQEDIRVVDVASYLGYQDPANFSRSFKKYFGFPPSDSSGQNS